MNQEKKYRRSHLCDLLEFVSANLSLSVYHCLQFASESPILPRKCFPFISRDSGLSMAQKFRVFNASSEKEDLATPRHTRSFGIHLAGSLQHRASTLLRSATPHRGVTRSCVPEAPAALLIVFSASGLFFYYSASFLTPISPCPVKHYSMGD